MNTANKRHDTGQFRNVKACELRRLKDVDVFSRLLASLARSLALVPSWFPSFASSLATYSFRAFDR
jgi:hypothetical protein